MKAVSGRRPPEGPHLELLRGPAGELLANVPGWGELAERIGSPFLTPAWLASWVAARAPEADAVVLVDESGSLAAGAVVRRIHGGAASAADDHSGRWTVVGADPASRRRVWESLATSGSRLVLDALSPDDADEAQTTLTSAGWRVARWEVPGGPRLQLPADPSEVLGRVSRGLRSQYRRRQRDIGRRGTVVLRTSQRAEDLEPLLRVEASGWKGRARTAVLSSPSTAQMYRDYARAVASLGHLRVQLLEVDGTVVAGDLSVGFAGAVHMLKTAYDESWAALSPGLVLRGMALQSAVSDGFEEYDTLGGADEYKLRWGGVPGRVVSLRAYRGPAAAAAAAAERGRPVLRSLRRRAHRTLASDG